MSEPTSTEIRTYFVRGRNALLARAEFGDLYVDYYLHQGQHEHLHEPAHDGLLKETLSAMALHCASRPWNEASAWTIHLQQPLVNLFVAGDNRRGSLAGQIFTENVKQDGQPRFISDLVRERGEPRRSVVDLEDVPADAFQLVERYYAQSEQRVARFFRLGPEEFVFLTAQPDCDLAWLEGLDEAAVRNLDQAEELGLLEQRHYRWDCGCSEQKMFGVLAPLMKQDPEALFGDDDVLRMSCPRCGARYIISRAALEAALKAA